MSIARVTVIRLHETPKFLVGQGCDQQVVDTLQGLARKYNRPCTLTLDRMEACGAMDNEGAAGDAHGKRRFSLTEVRVHLKGLYATSRIGVSTSLIWLSWLLIGLAYPLYNVFLPSYLHSRGASFGVQSEYVQWRNYAIVNACSVPGPVLAGFMCTTPLGRKYTMVVGALVTMAFFFAYTQVRNEAQNLGFNCAISFCLVRRLFLRVLHRLRYKADHRVVTKNIYYGTLYAYTPEVMPSAHRGTGNGIAIGFNRIMGIISAVIATVSNVRYFVYLTWRRACNGLATVVDYRADQHGSAYIHLRRVVHRHGRCGSRLSV